MFECDAGLPNQRAGDGGPGEWESQSGDWCSFGAFGCQDFMDDRVLPPGWAED